MFIAPRNASLWLLSLLLLRADAARPEIVIADFEQADYGAWTSTGSAFGTAPGRGALPNQMELSGFQGKGFVSSYNGGDSTTGTLTSPEFVLERDTLALLVGGGGYPEKTCVNLLVDGEVVRTATGPNTEPGGSEVLTPVMWDVRPFAGKKARVAVIDNATGIWGHINVDHLVLTDAARLAKEFVCEKRLLNLPVKTGAPKRRATLEIEGVVVRDFEIEWAEDAPDFWVPLDLTAFRGKKAALVVASLDVGAPSLAGVEQSDVLTGSAQLYREALRPQFHFSAQRGWLNDPNGLVFYAGEYHLFFQHNPYGVEWGNMHWGHAVSTDLLHWRELPIALYPRRFGDWAFSGSAVVDARNTGGWKSGNEDVLVAAYTSTGRGECIVFSNDRGRSWEEFSGNPVVRHNGRDPRLLWHAPSGQWVMCLYDESEGKRWFTFHTSPDLKAWTFQSRIEGFFECPDFFELPLDGDPAKKKWVLTGASSEYMIGSFDGRVFTPETPKLPGHRGEAFYAAQTFTNEPRGRIIQIGWGQQKTPGMPFNQMMAFPCELSLRTTADGPRLCWQPISELATLRKNSRTIAPQTLAPGANPLAEVTGDALELSVEFEPGSAAEIALEIGGVRISYFPAKNELAAGPHRVALTPVNGRVKLRALLDRTSIELFANDGAVFMPLARPLDAVKAPRLTASGGIAKIVALEIHDLKSIWPASDPAVAAAAGEF